MERRLRVEERSEVIELIGQADIDDLSKERIVAAPETM